MDFDTTEKIEMGRDRENLEIKLGNYVFIDHDGHMVDKNDRLASANIEKIMDKVTKFHL